MGDMVPAGGGFAGVPIAHITGQVQAIQQLMAEVMVKGNYEKGIEGHYAVIPGTKKLSLLKAGAEKIGLLFRLAPHYEVEKEFDGEHLTVTVKCTLSHIEKGTIWGEGLGMCSTKENKFRFRAGEGEVTEHPVPKAYWDAKRNDPKKALELIGGPGFGVKKTDTGWYITKKGGDKVEHTNPADYYNTVIKIAKKRSHVDAIITATAASDIFTQDLNDPEPVNAKDS